MDSQCKLADGQFQNKTFCSLCDYMTQITLVLLKQQNHLYNSYGKQIVENVQCPKNYFECIDQPNNCFSCRFQQNENGNVVDVNLNQAIFSTVQEKSVNQFVQIKLKFKMNNMMWKSY
ncbi:unnamed protein product [Paramecium sonneborni]|uniref:Uncharacterized protein n=1 Tax=Paramecium sonneborni TaxID=65129 RepID=A0A8S1RPL3_9CILI|nr:unnamed protein product [Paramecium sonneborni]